MRFSYSHIVFLLPSSKCLYIPETSLHGSRHVPSQQRTSDPGRKPQNDMNKKQYETHNSH